MQRLIVFAHLVSVAVYLGATVFLTLLVEFVGRRSPDAVGRRRRFAVIFRVYNPLTIGALGVVVMTGAWSLTPYKEALGGGYFAAVGAPLVTKLTLAFLLIIMATYVSFGLCHRVVRADQGGLPVTDAALRSILSRLRAALWATLVIALVTLWVATGLRSPGITG
jgi:hypothetical protein